MLIELKFSNSNNILVEITNICFCRSICDTEEFELRFLDTGECHKRFINEIYALAEPFAVEALPGQSFNLHLVSITPGRIKGYLVKINVDKCNDFTHFKDEINRSFSNFYC